MTDWEKTASEAWNARGWREKRRVNIGAHAEAAVKMG